MRQTKHKVTPPTKPDASAAFPPWLPRPVGAWIEGNRSHPEHKVRAAIIDRLARDRRLKPLWDELQRRKPRGWVYPANVTALETVCGPIENEDEAHGLVLIYLFKQILHASVTLYPARTNAGADAEVEGYRNRAAMLRAEAVDTEQLPAGAGGIDWVQVAGGMRAQADVLDQLADDLRGLRLTVPHARSNLAGLRLHRESRLFCKSFSDRRCQSKPRWWPRC